MYIYIYIHVYIRSICDIAKSDICIYIYNHENNVPTQ